MKRMDTGKQGKIGREKNEVWDAVGVRKSNANQGKGSNL